ncbi:MAG: sulfatase [Leptospira sp.]|nr:sulfatase [Leptospira sp.]
MKTGVCASLFSIFLSIHCGALSLSLSPLPEDAETTFFSLQHKSKFKTGKVKNHLAGTSKFDFSKPTPIRSYSRSKFKHSPWTDENLPIFTHFYDNYYELITEKYFYLEKDESIEWNFQGSLNHNLTFARANVKLGLEWTLFCNEEKIYSSSNDHEDQKIIARCTDPSGNSRLTLKNESGQNVLVPNIYLFPKEKLERELTNIPTNPKVLFIVIDSLRFDALGLYHATPFLDEFKNDSISFNRHFVNSAWTRPSTTIFFTGNYASESALNIWDYPLSKEEVNDFYNQPAPLPALLSKSGIHTTMMGNNPFMDTVPGIGADFGFTKVADFSDRIKDTIPITKYIIDSYEKIPQSHFIFLNYNDPHRPYTPPEQYLKQLRIPPSERRNLTDQKLNYLGEVAFVDANVRKVIDHLKDQGTYEDTLIIITSDHGEVMDPKHAYSPFSEINTMYGHGQGLYQEDIHVPLLIKFPKNSSFSKFHGSSSKFLTRSVDLMPSILKELNVSNPNEIRGIPLQNLLLGEDNSSREYYGEARGVKAYQKDNYKLKQKTYEFHRLGSAWNEKQKPETEYFFDLEADPQEHFPLKTPLIENTISPSQLQIYKELQEKLNTTIPPKSYYGIRINQRDLKESFQKGNLKIEITIPHGRFKKVYGKNFFSEQSIQNFGTKQIISLNLEDYKNLQTEFFFQIYPDVSEPSFKIYKDQLPISGKEWGVGSFDLNPLSCKGKECKQLILSESGIPPAVNEFRIQIWKVGTVASTLVDRKKLGSEAMNALQKQGYVE